MHIKFLIILSFCWRFPFLVQIACFSANRIAKAKQPTTHCKTFNESLEFQGLKSSFVVCSLNQPPARPPIRLSVHPCIRSLSVCWFSNFFFFIFPLFQFSRCVLCTSFNWLDWMNIQTNERVTERMNKCIQHQQWFYCQFRLSTQYYRAYLVHMTQASEINIFLSVSQSCNISMAAQL